MNPSTHEQVLNRTGKVTFTLKGVSMRPLFHADTDAIVVKKCDPDELKDLDIVLFKRYSPVKNEQFVLHRIIGKPKNGNYTIIGDNCIDADIVPAENILGVVASAQRNGKPIKLSGLRYSLYERLWCKPYRVRFVVLGFMRKLRRIARRVIKGTV